MNNNPPTKTWLVIIMVLITAVLLSGIFLYSQGRQAKKPVSQAPVSQSQPQLAEGLKKAQEMVKTYPKLIKRISIQQQIEGTLQAVTDKSWTVTGNSETMVIPIEGNSKIRYNKVEKFATGSAAPAPKEIQAKDLKVGDHVVINQTIDWESGQTNVLAIAVLPLK